MPCPKFAQDAAKFLIAHGANYTNSHVLTAASRCSADFLKYLLSLPGIVINPPEEDSPLHYYLQARRRLLLKNAGTIAILAILEENIRLLLAHGADPNHKNYLGESPLYWAYADPAMRTLLLEHGMIPHLQNN